MFEGKKLICPISGSTKFSKIFTIRKFPIYMGVVNKSKRFEFKQLTFNINKSSGSVQIHPKVPLKKLYFKPHGSGTVGMTWKNHHSSFFKFLNKDFKNLVIEIGGGHNSVSESIGLSGFKKDYKLISFDPNGKKYSNPNHFIVKDFFSKKYVKKYKDKISLVIHSHLFEHIYDPNNFLMDINNSLKIGGLHIFSVPNLKFMIKNGYSNAMNFEHPYFLEESMIDYLLKKNGFKILEKRKYLNHSIFYKTKKTTNNPKKINVYRKFEINKRLFKDYYRNLKKDINLINKKIKTYQNVYLFGAHIFSQMLIFNGLDISLIKNILDNDKKKHNQYLYGTKIKVVGTKNLRKVDKPIIILRAAQYSNEIKKDILKNINYKTRFI